MTILAGMNLMKGLWRKEKKMVWGLSLAAHLYLHTQKQNNLVKTINKKISNNYFSVQ